VRRGPDRASPGGLAIHAFADGHGASDPLYLSLMKPRNRQARIALTWVLVSVVALLGVVLPLALGMDGMAGGYAIAFASGFVALVALIAAAVFAARARILKRLLAGQGVLVHWTYPDPERRDQARKELAEEQKGSWILFLIIAGFSLVIGVGFLIADPEAGRYVLLVLAGVVALLAGLAALAPRIRFAKRRRATPEAIVSREAGYVFGMLHTWKLLGARLEGTDVTSGRDPVLRVTYSAPVVYARFFLTRQQYTVSIPIPHGEEERAREIARALEGSNGGRP